MKQIINFALGALFLGIAIGGAYATWGMLPAGRYPVIVAGIPALPFVWLSWLFLKKTKFSELSQISLFLVVLTVLIAVGVTISVLSEHGIIR